MEAPRPSRRERRAQEHATRKKQESARQSRRTLLKRLAAAAGVVGVGAGAVAVARSIESRREKSLKEKVLSFTWKNTENTEKFKAFVETLADEYLKITKAPRLKKDDLVGLGKTNFFSSRGEFVEALKHVTPHTPHESEWGLHNPASKKVFLDMATLKRYAQASGVEAGTTLLTTLWHEWGHPDLIEREHGTLINHPSREFSIISNQTGKNEPFKRYQGGLVYSETDHAFLRWNEVLVETITQRRIREQVGLQHTFLTGNYKENGIDVLIPFTRSAGISIDTLYTLYATSDFEGQATLLGRSLPGGGDSLQKGLRLIEGIYENHPAMIRQTGVFERIPR